MKKKQIKMVNVLAIIGVLVVVLVVYTATSEKKHYVSRMPDPASVYCGMLGYRIEVRTNPDGGQVGYCIFPDGTNCTDGSFYMGKCGQKWTYCERHGGKIIIRSDGVAPNGTILVSGCVDGKYPACVFSNGSVYPEWKISGLYKALYGRGMR